VILETNSDISERRRAEEEVRRLNTVLEARVEARTRELQSANEALEAFGRTVAHDLRAPLRNMQGFARALLEDYADRLEEEGRMYAERIAAGAERMDVLIRDLLSYARLSRAEMQYERVYPEQAVRLVLQDMESDLQRRKAQVAVQAEMPPVMANRAALAAIFSNLISNAMKFTEPGKAPEISVRADRHDGVVRLSVEDHGIGINEQHHHRIFEVFERLHGQETYPGTGIGLAIVRKGAERMGGSSGVESSVGKGATFWVELPAA
jgi:signal transduction histidine kinase